MIRELVSGVRGAEMGSNGPGIGRFVQVETLWQSQQKRKRRATTETRQHYFDGACELCEREQRRPSANSPPARPSTGAKVKPLRLDFQLTASADPVLFYVVFVCCVCVVFALRLTSFHFLVRWVNNGAEPGGF